MVNGKLAIIPLGGATEIGKNLTVYRLGDQLLVVDCGLMFPTDEMLGVDILIPDVTYLVENKNGKWVHSTVFHVPAYSTVKITVYQFDTATGLRNPFWGQPRGTVGGTISVDGKTLNVLNPDDASHTFAIPDLGVSVPLKGIADDAKNQCGAAPCALSMAHTTTTFSFKTGKPGKYRWQCFVPCAAGFILGNGGPMQSVGYMDGYLVVV